MTSNRNQIPVRDFAVEYAQLFKLGGIAVNETRAQFRARIARELRAMGEHIYAKEALHNERMSGDLFAYILDSGYGEDHIDTIAVISEYRYQYNKHMANQPSFLEQPLEWLKWNSSKWYEE